MFFISIVIINHTDDFYSHYFINQLIKQEIPFIELGSFKSNTYTYIQNELIYNDLPIKNISCVYIRSIELFIPSNLNHSYMEIYNEKMSYENNLESLKAWLFMLQQQGIPILNYSRFDSKQKQINILQRYNICLPDTCITNSYNDMVKFRDKIQKSIVMKPLSGGEYCREVKLEEVSNANFAEPIIFQEKIVGEDIRVYVLSDKVIAAHSVPTDYTTIDYRQQDYYRKHNKSYELVSLPKEVQEMCVKASKVLGLLFSGIDLKKTFTNQYFLLECNSLPQYLDLEFKNQIPITQYIIDHLIGNIKNATAKSIKSQKKQNKNSVRIFDYQNALSKYLMQNKGDIVSIPINSTQLEELSKYYNDISRDSFLYFNVIDGEAKFIGVK